MFGFGPGATEHMPIEMDLAYNRDNIKLWSWDNHYAATLVEGGVAGLGLLFLLYGATVLGQWKLLRNAAEKDRTMQAAILAGMLVLVFMMSNVAIFAPQLTYLYWTLTASGIVIGRDTGGAPRPIESEVAHAEPV
jgi:O-antigen ligase